MVDAATGAGIEGATVTASGVQVGGSSRTDADGRATLFLDSREARRRRISASHPNYRSDSERKRVDPAEAGPHARFELDRSVPCRGRAFLPPGMEPGERTAMSVRSIDGGRGRWHRFDDEELTFSISGMMPGTYRAFVWSGRQRTASLTFELGPNGDEDLALRFEERP